MESTKNNFPLTRDSALKLKKGDKLVCLEPGTRLEKGKVYTFIAFRASSYSGRIYVKEVPAHSFFPRRFSYKRKKKIG